MIFKKFMTLETNSQEGMKHQLRGATQAQQAMTLRITLIPPTSCPIDSCASSIVQFTGRFTTGGVPTLRNNWLQFHDRCMESDYKLLSSSLLSSCNPASFVALWAVFFHKKKLWCCHIGDHPQVDLATFGYGQTMKVQIYWNPCVLLA
jgi:hypothetical protein